MRKSIIWSVRRAQRGFTLIELLAVMAVIGVLAGIVTTSVSGTGQTSAEAQAQSDAGTVQTAASTFFTDQEATLVESPKSVAVTAAIASAINIDPDSDVFGEVTYDIDIEAGEAVDPDTQTFTQKTSSRWPENFITENSDTIDADTSACVDSSYCDEFPTEGLHTDGVVVRVIVADSGGAAIERATLLEEYTAVDFATMTEQGYVEDAPDSAEQTADIDVSGVTINVSNFLWLFRKSTTSGGGAEDDARSVVVFKLASAKVTEGVDGADSTVTLSYAQIF